MFNQNFKKSIKKSFDLFGDGILFGSGLRFVISQISDTDTDTDTDTLSLSDNVEFGASIAMVSVGLSFKAISNIIE